MKISLKYRSLPKDCKTFLDVIDIMESSEEQTPEVVLNRIEQDQKILTKTLDKQVSYPTMDTKTIDTLLENVQRLSEAKQFFCKHFL